jgi:hypothetical protein
MIASLVFLGMLVLTGDAKAAPPDKDLARAASAHFAAVQFSVSSTDHPLPNPLRQKNRRQRAYFEDDNSHNNWLVALMSNGEGWHNNHHAEPRCASHGRRWWELDLSYLSIRLLELAGLAWNVVKPGRQTLDGPDELRVAA